MQHIIIIEPLFEGEITSEKSQEITALVQAAEAEPVGVISQTIKKISPKTYIGEGKALEIKDLAERLKADLAVFDGELSPSQTLNISDCIGIPVINRTNLILDIFALRARSPEGKILVELAQLNYIYPRLKGRGDSLSRLGGGIGTRGPGESKLETDRRHIRRRIDFLENSLKKIEKRRESEQLRRGKNRIKTVALVGYTNAGKSTLLNALTKSDVVSKNELFVTLDPTSRKTVFGEMPIIIVDTVGFVKDLPAELKKAFKSTLESARNADVILNVADATADWKQQHSITDSTLKELGCNQDLVIKVINKCDLLSDISELPPSCILISAKNKRGLENLKLAIEQKLNEKLITLKTQITYSKAPILSELKRYCESLTTDYGEEKISIEFSFKKTNEEKISKLIF